MIPHDILKRRSIVSLSTRMIVSPTQQAALIEAVVKVSGGDVARIATSYATADRSRRSVAKCISQKVQQEWNAQKAATLHWDGKQTSK